MVTTEGEEMGVAGFVESFQSARHARHYTLDNHPVSVTAQVSAKVRREPGAPRQFVEKLRYIHRNPVKAGLCEQPEDWEWSSSRHYATGCEGRVEIESECTARKRERATGRLCPAVELPHSSQNRA